MAMPPAQAIRYTPRYLLKSLFSMASKNLRYRSISKVAAGCRSYPYRKYKNANRTTESFQVISCAYP
jgi:hypothetical protein